MKNVQKSSGTGSLPIFEVADEIERGLRARGKIVLAAPTGSGKSTQVPQMLLDRGLAEGEIIVLQPRRLAARMLAHRVAAERSVALGDEVGYQIRFDNKTSRATRIVFVTEAILLRRILADPELKGVGAVVFDEFHERNLFSDLSLSEVRRCIAERRPDLRLVVMSATFSLEPVVSYLGNALAVRAEGRLYPLSIEYTGAAIGHQTAPVWERAVAALKRAQADQCEGNILIFMPGAYEIGRTLRALENAPFARGYQLHALHGGLSPDQQDAAVGPSSQPKIIVSTNVAETSLTIDGVRVVIDSGLARIARYDSKRGINSLLVESISRASADQRAGRAGRTGPGQVYRLWSEAEHAARAAEDCPEVLRVDLTEMALLLTAAGRAFDAGAVEAWFERPTGSAVELAQAQLQMLGAVDGAGQATPMGKQMASLPQHPRYARMLVEGAKLGVLRECAEIAALLESRPIYRPFSGRGNRALQEAEVEAYGEGVSDLLVQLRALKLAESFRFDLGRCQELNIHAAGARQAALAARQTIQTLERAGAAVSSEPVAPGVGSSSLEERVGRCLLCAFSDHLALRIDRGTRRARTVSGKVGELRRESVVDGDLLIACEQEEREVRGDVTVLLGMAHAVSPRLLESLFPNEFFSGNIEHYDSAQRKVISIQERRFRSLVLEQAERGRPTHKAAGLLAKEVFEGRLVLKKWTKAVDQWIARVNFLAHHCPESEISGIDAEARLLLLEQVCEGAVSYREIKDREVFAVVSEWISPEQRYYLEAWAPAEWQLPRRKRPTPIHYHEDGRARIAATVQELYDVPGDTLRLANGKVPLIIEILAPNRKAVQLTEDLDGFWERTYASVRKDLAGRYPKHEWR